MAFPAGIKVVIIGFFALCLHKAGMRAAMPPPLFALPLGAGWVGRVHGDGALSLLDETRTVPFQSAAWLRAWLADPAEAATFRLIEITDAAGAGILLPVSLRPRGGLRLAVKPGGAHASFLVVPVIGHTAIAPPGGWAAALKTLARAARIDAFLLADGPEYWAGSRNILSELPRKRAPEDVSLLTIPGKGEVTLARLSDRDARKKLRYRRSKFAAMGTLESGWCDPAEASGTLDAFLDWKARQFAAQGLRDPFADSAIRAFLARAVAGDGPAIRLFRLTLDGRPIALIGVAIAGNHASGMFTAYDPAPEISRHSPGDVLMADLVTALADGGIGGFDLGVGAARYKAHYCPERLPLFDCALAVSPQGRLAVTAWRIARHAKGVVKKQPRLLALVRRIRRLLPG
jgi:CelD/BcsL family acetyltransferase involved in cellulose biosynthesis